MAEGKPLIFAMGKEYLDHFVYRVSYEIAKYLRYREECIGHIRECHPLCSLSEPEIGAVLDCMVCAGLAVETRINSGYYRLTEWGQRAITEGPWG